MGAVRGVASVPERNIRSRRIGPPIVATKKPPNGAVAVRFVGGERTVASVRANDDRWDVVVVGLRDSSHASTMMVVAEIVHYASLPEAEVERCLMAREDLEVMVNLDRAEAERAAHELHQIGVVVDLRLASSGRDVMPVLKPDADRQVGLAVGGFIDDSATPPSIADDGVFLPEVEPDPESVTIRRPRAQTPGDGVRVSLGSGAGRRRPISERPVVTRGHHGDPLDRLSIDSGEQDVLDLGRPAPRVPVSRRPTPSHVESPRPSAPVGPPPADPAGPGSYGIYRDRDGIRGVRQGEPMRNEAPRAAPRAMPVRRNRPPSNPHVPELYPEAAPAARPAPSRPVAESRARPRPRSATPAASARPAPARPAAKAKPLAPSGDRARRATPMADSAFAAPTIDDASPLSAVEAPKLPQRLEKTAAISQAPEAGLQLDFEAAGMVRRAPPSASPLAGVPQGGVPAPAAAPGLMEPPRATSPDSSPADQPEPPSLLKLLETDRVSWTLLTMTVALVIGLITAFSVQRDEVRDDLPLLEQELAASLNDPSAVDSGELRTPAEIEDELSGLLDDIERSFFMVWFFTAVPMGLATSRYVIRVS